MLLRKKVIFSNFARCDLETNAHGEIMIDRQGATSMPGVFAAGDCTNTVFKQIIISMGSDATTALGAFDYMIRQTSAKEHVTV